MKLINLSHLEAINPSPITVWKCKLGSWLWHGSCVNLQCLRLDDDVTVKLAVTAVNTVNAV